MNILATVDNINYWKNFSHKKPLFKTFSIQSKTKTKRELIRTMLY